jgi:hypothetical protein
LNLIAITTILFASLHISAMPATFQIVPSSISFDRACPKGTKLQIVPSKAHESATIQLLYPSSIPEMKASGLVAKRFFCQTSFKVHKKKETEIKFEKMHYLNHFVTSHHKSSHGFYDVSWTMNNEYFTEILALDDPKANHLVSPVIKISYPYYYGKGVEILNMTLSEEITILYKETKPEGVGLEIMFRQ